MKKHESAFELLGVSERETRSLATRAQLIYALQDIIKRQKWTQRDAAKFFETSQPRICDLSKGRVEKFSVGKLIDMLSIAGYQFEFIYDPTRLESLKADIRCPMLEQ